MRWIERLRRNGAQRRTGAASATPTAGQTWLWVTGPEFYLDDDGRDQADLDPASFDGPRGWWTCHSDTRFGDLALLYRARQRKDIAYLVRAESDAYPLSAGDGVPGRNTHGCDYTVVKKFSRPLSIEAMRADPSLAEWAALKINFNGSVHRVPPAIWKRLLDRLTNRRPEELRSAIEHRARELEDELALERYLVDNGDIWRKLGYSLELRDRQRRWADRTRADLVYWDKAGGQYVVVELKARTVNGDTVGQVLRYMANARNELAGGRPTKGIVIGADLGKWGKSLLEEHPEVAFVSHDDLGASVVRRRTKRTRLPKVS